MQGINLKLWAKLSKGSSRNSEGNPEVRGGAVGKATTDIPNKENENPMSRSRTSFQEEKGELGQWMRGEGRKYTPSLSSRAGATSVFEGQSESKRLQLLKELYEQISVPRGTGALSESLLTTSHINTKHSLLEAEQNNYTERGNDGSARYMGASLEQIIRSFNGKLGDIGDIGGIGDTGDTGDTGNIGGIGGIGDIGDIFREQRNSPFSASGRYSNLLSHTIGDTRDIPYTRDTYTGREPPKGRTPALEGKRGNGGRSNQRYISYENLSLNYSPSKLNRSISTLSRILLSHHFALWRGRLTITTDTVSRLSPRELSLSTRTLSPECSVAISNIVEILEEARSRAHATSTQLFISNIKYTYIYEYNILRVLRIQSILQQRERATIYKYLKKWYFARCMLSVQTLEHTLGLPASRKGILKYIHLVTLFKRRSAFRKWRLWIREGGVNKVNKVNKVNNKDRVNNNRVVNTNIPSIECTDRSDSPDLSSLSPVIIHHSHEKSDGKGPIWSKRVEIGSIKRARKREGSESNSGESELSITERSKRMRLLTEQILGSLNKGNKEQLLGGFGGKAKGVHSRQETFERIKGKLEVICHTANNPNPILLNSNTSNTIN